MSGIRAQDTTRRLRDIREGLDVMLVSFKDQPESLRNVQKACQVADLLQTLAPQTVDGVMLSTLEKFVEGADHGIRGLVYFKKFGRYGNLFDLEQAIASWQRAVELTPHDHPDMPSRLSNLGSALLKRFEQVGSPVDLEAGISQIQQAVNLTPDGNPSKPRYLNNLGLSLRRRFERQGSLADLEHAILHMQKALDATPDGHASKPLYLQNLGGALMIRFGRHGALVDLEDGIVQLRSAVDLTPEGDPGKPSCLSSLGGGMGMRFNIHGVPADLEDAISHLREAVNLTPDGHPSKPQYLYNFGEVLKIRFERFGSLTDLEEAIGQIRKAVGLTHDSHHAKSFFLSHLGHALEIYFKQKGSLVNLEDAILHYREAVDLTPNGHPDQPTYLSNLGSALRARFFRCGSLADLEDAISQQRKAVDLIPDGHLEKPDCHSRLAATLAARFEQHGSLADLDDSILQERKALNLTPKGFPQSRNRLNNLGIGLLLRFNRQGLLADLDEAISLQRKGLDLLPDDHPDRPRGLNNLGNALLTRFDRNSLIIDLEEATLQQREAVDLTPDVHIDKPRYLSSLADTLQTRFHRDKALPDLEDAILYRQKAVDLMTPGNLVRVSHLSYLSHALRVRFEHLGDRKDLQSALSAARESAESQAAPSMLRLEATLSWADCCVLGRMSLLPAFECAINLLPQVAWLGLAVDDQYFLLAKIRSVACDAVAAAIAEDDLTKAVEWVEQGRSIVWQNLLNLRTPLEELRSQYPKLAMRLQELSRCLEQSVDMSSIQDISLSSDTTSSQMGVAMERDKLIKEVRNKAGFDSFMKPKSLYELAPAARDGTVVLLNLGGRRCDALVLRTDAYGAAHVVSVPLERVTSQSAEQLSKKLMDLLSNTGVRARDSRKHRFYGASDNKHAIFKEILRTLWLDYVRPIVDELAYQVNLELPPRLWWCTTGPSAFLPLHAAGLYEDNEIGHKLSDYVISSYTPTLTALLDKSSPISSEEVKILTVAVANTPDAPLPCTIEEVRKLQHLAANLPVVNLMNEEATQTRVLKELQESTWAHLACHGEQVGGKPMESGLVLHDGKLKLSEIVKTRLPNADLVFLSACQTALGDGGIPEESAHLAAGMLFAGYRGVVATMWSIQDDIAPRIAEDFYRYMFRDGKPNREEAAYALHRAVRSLQESKVPFTSWVPFIHIGR